MERMQRFTLSAFAAAMLLDLAGTIGHEVNKPK